MQCHNCKKKINESDSKQVGPWHFCSGCFDAFMKKTEANPESVDVSPGDALAVSPTRVDSKKKCALCEKGIGDDPFKMGLLTVCRACYQELITRPKPVKQPAAPPEETVVSQKETEDIASQYREMTECHGCGRTIHQVGAKVHEDHFYCPDCYYAKEKPSLD